MLDDLSLGQVVVAVFVEVGLIGMFFSFASRFGGTFDWLRERWFCSWSLRVFWVLLLGFVFVFSVVLSALGAALESGGKWVYEHERVRVLSVIDGHTLEVLLPGEKVERVRLLAVDAPGMDTPEGVAARDAVKRWVFGSEYRAGKANGERRMLFAHVLAAPTRVVRLDGERRKEFVRDRYGRVVGSILGGWYSNAWQYTDDGGFHWRSYPSVLEDDLEVYLALNVAEVEVVDYSRLYPKGVTSSFGGGITRFCRW